jgi:DNA polymerase-3 subunit delta'
MARAPVEAPEVPEGHPRRTTFLAGHERTETLLRQTWDSKRLHHAWLLTGPQGIGKATLAYRFARFVLADGAAIDDGLSIAPSHPVQALVANAAHRDLRTIERIADPKTKKMRSEILVSQVRSATDFLALTASDGGWRIMVIDPIDDLNINASNALLKILEEPPKATLLLLISHQPGLLLPTIRSRCRVLPMPALDDVAVDQVLNQKLPDLTSEQRRGLVMLAEGSVGRAINLAEEGGDGLHQALIGVFKRDGSIAWDRAALLGDRVMRGDGAMFASLGEMLSRWLERIIRVGRDQPVRGSASDGEITLARAIAERAGLERVMDVWDKTNHLIQRTDSLNLHRKQALLTLLGGLEQRQPSAKRDGS